MPISDSGEKECGSRKRYRTSKLEGTAAPIVDTSVGEERCPSPAQNPPVEILSEIFLHGVSDGYIVPFKAETLSEWRALFSTVFPLNIALANRTWRHTALRTRGLWSTWFIKMDSPSEDALSMLKCVLKLFIRRSGTNTLKPHIYLSGSFNAAFANESMGPLLECQERWEDAEIYAGNKGVGDPGMTLVIARLSSLKRLTVFGTSWNSVGSGPRIFNPEYNIPSSVVVHDLPSLRYAELIYLPIVVATTIIFVAPNLTELILQIYDDIEEPWDTLPIRIPLPSVRKFCLHRYSRRPDDELQSLLPRLKFEVLEELTINCLSLPSSRQGILLSLFLTINHLQTTLLSFRFFKDPESTHDEDVLHLIRSLSNLRTLEVHWREVKSHILLLMLTPEDGLAPEICPLLEEFTLVGGRGSHEVFTGFVTTRWNASDRRIRAMTFVDCEVSFLSSLWTGPTRMLTKIKNVDPFIQEG